MTSTEGTLHWPGDFTLRGHVHVPPTSKPFAYTDGDDVEAEMLDGLRHVDDLRVLSSQVAGLIHNWPTRYHFSSRRASLLRPLQLKPGSRVLEIGAGCGAVSRFLGEQGHTVIAVEGSSARAAIAGERNRDLSAVHVVEADLKRLTFDEPFDAVVMVGVLEYAAEFDDAPSPHEALLRRCSELLAPDGALVLAIENRLGLKYLAGTAEDHLGVPYVGVDAGYPAQGPRTFARHELDALLDSVGLRHVRHLTPIPDYKLVRAVVDFEHAPPEALVALAQVSSMAMYEDVQLLEVPPFSLEQTARHVVQDGMGVGLGNSFLVLASMNAASVATLVSPDEYAWVYAVERRHGARKSTVLMHRATGSWAEHRPLADDLAPVPNAVVNHRLASSPLLVGVPTVFRLLDGVNQHDWTIADLTMSLAAWFDALLELTTPGGELSVTTALDATPFNCITDLAGRTQFFDQEWSLVQPAPVSWVGSRGILYSLEMITSCSAPAPGTGLNRWTLTRGIITALLQGAGLESHLDRHDFVAWLAEVQSAASAAPLAQSASGLERLLDSSLRARDTPGRLDLLRELP